MVTFFENIWLKLLAVVLALLIWLHVATEKNYTYVVSLPVTEISLRDTLTLSAPAPDSVTLAVSASGKQLLRKQWKRDGIRINAAQYPAGEQVIELTPLNTSLVAPSDDLSIEDIISPNYIKLDIDTQAQFSVPVNPEISSEPDDGFALGCLITVVPSHISVSGPRSKMNILTSVSTLPIDLRGLRDKVTLNTPLNKQSLLGFSTKFDTVNVTLEVVPVKTKTLSSIPIVVFNAPPDAEITTTPRSIDLVVSGPQDEIDSLSASAITVSADYRRADPAGRAELKFDYPKIFKLKSFSADSVQISPPPNAYSGN
ncbi:MAG: CdaR family protein [candidate division Zixibacteria bacterium]|nr:CdaR family protein [candidate division Zixibacteria bacterium]